MLEHAELGALLPHRHPILLVDRVTVLEPGVRIETAKAVSGCEPCYAGLPDGSPVAAYAYPAALLVESFVQSGALLWAGTAAADGDTFLLGGLGEVAFGASAYPGDVLVHHVRLRQVVGSNAILDGVSTVAGTGRPALTVGSLVLARRPAGVIATPGPVRNPAGRQGSPVA